MPHPPSRAPRGARFRVRRSWVVLACLASLQACVAHGSDAEGDAIPKDTFVLAYVQLREAALNLAPERVDSARAAILAEHHLTQQDLLTFADVHGRDVNLMKDVWDEVEKRLDALTRDSIKVH
jgi:hypothetical protein